MIISVCVWSIGAGNASILSDVSISVSLDESAVWRSAICLVYTIFAFDLSDKKEVKTDFGCLVNYLYDKIVCCIILRCAVIFLYFMYVRYIVC